MAGGVVSFGAADAGAGVAVGFGVAGAAVGVAAVVGDAVAAADACAGSAVALAGAVVGTGVGALEVEHAARLTAAANTSMPTRLFHMFPLLSLPPTWGAFLHALCAQVVPTRHLTGRW